MQQNLKDNNKNRKTRKNIVSRSDSLGQFHQLSFYKQLFTHASPKSGQKIIKLSVFFALSGSACAKVACRTLMKLTPGVNLTKHYFFANTNFFRFSLLSWVILQLIHYLHMQQTLKLNIGNWKTRENICRIDSRCFFLLREPQLSSSCIVNQRATFA